MGLDPRRRLEGHAAAPGPQPEERQARAADPGREDGAPRPTFFATQADWRNWLQANHGAARELSVGYWKVGSRRASMTWPQSVDEALCFGWIDGVRHRIDDDAYRIRFTPRKRDSVWSQVNLNRYAELEAAGRVAPAGRAAFEAGRERAARYSYEKPAGAFSPEELARFQANRDAWEKFSAFPPGYRRTAIDRVVSASGAQTRARRLDILIAASAEGRRLGSATK